MVGKKGPSRKRKKMGLPSMVTKEVLSLLREEEREGRALAAPAPPPPPVTRRRRQSLLLVTMPC